MPKTEFLQIRLSPHDRERVNQAATADHLEPSTWARQVILRALDEASAAKDAPSQDRKNQQRFQEN